MTLKELQQLIGGICLDAVKIYQNDDAIYNDLRRRAAAAEEERDFYKNAYDKIAEDFNALAAKAEAEGVKWNG